MNESVLCMELWFLLMLVVIYELLRSIFGMWNVVVWICGCGWCCELVMLSCEIWFWILGVLGDLVIIVLWLVELSKWLMVCWECMVFGYWSFILIFLRVLVWKWYWLRLFKRWWMLFLNLVCSFVCMWLVIELIVRFLIFMSCFVFGLYVKNGSWGGVLNMYSIFIWMIFFGLVSLV